jgi:manganese oxidase
MNKYFILLGLILVNSLYGHNQEGSDPSMHHTIQPASLPKNEEKKASLTRVITPNVGSLNWTMDGEVKVFHLIAEPISREFAPGFWVNCWGYNGSSPGPTIEAVEGDRVRLLVTNHLNEPTTVHWHGIILPNGMDGVAGLTQKAIPPGETFKYEFTLRQNGTFMYHPHTDEMFQIAMGMMGFFIIHPKINEDPSIDRDFAIFLHEWRIPMGTKTPIPFEMLDFNLFTFNSVLYPKIESLVAKKGDRVRIRLANVMMNSHPIHLHGHEFVVTRKGAQRLPPSAQYTENTMSVAPGETRDIEFRADNPGDWAFHCHKSHHTMNQMQHDLPNLTGIHKGDLEKRIQQYFPEFMGLMNINGMGDMFEMYGAYKRDMNAQMAFPSNISPMGNPGPFGVIELGGMFTVFKVREGLTSYADPGWYQHPPGTVAESVNANQENENPSHHHNMPSMQKQTEKVSWFSREEENKEPKDIKKMNWMQSRPEDSMGGHMPHGMGGTSNQTRNQMQHQGH